jgi:hypothetical protein
LKTPISLEEISYSYDYKWNYCPNQLFLWPIVKLVLFVILDVNVCSHICDYNVDMTKWKVYMVKILLLTNYNLWLLHVWMEK